MTNKEFKTLCNKYFKSKGFKKHRTQYFLMGNGILCGIYLQKSYFGPYYYIDCDYYIDYNNPDEYPSHYIDDVDLSVRFELIKFDHRSEKYILTRQYNYEESSEEEIIKGLDREFDNHITPILEGGLDILILDFDYYFDNSHGDFHKKILNKIYECKGYLK